MKIAYVTTYNLMDSSKWLKYNQGNYGSSQYIFNSLKSANININCIGDLQNKHAWISRSKWIFYRQVFQQNYYSWAEPLICQNYSQQININLEKVGADIILSPEGFTPLAYLNCHQPLVLWLDTITASLIDYYPYLSNLCYETKKNIYLLEKTVLNKCKKVIFTSDWAGQEAIRIYGIPEEKIAIIPRGANFELYPGRNTNEIYQIIKSRSQTKIKLTYIGIDWQRKGGDIAYQIAKTLHNNGLNIEFKIIGDLPKNIDKFPNFVKPVGYINKSTPEGKKNYYHELADSHFLILPTQADITPNVLIEANAFGVPCISTHIGGIPTIIKDNLNGKLFKLDDSITNYCDYITNTFQDYSTYENLAISSFNEYCTRLNWKAVANTAKQIFTNLT
ncbi:MAG: glycosyltransferase family 4 protein [Methylacidiphilales bacterium]|nr:glycosyltransferase family 4 protein [Candidatus Methylacidiphilales bacterium]